MRISDRRIAAGAFVLLAACSDRDAPANTQVLSRVETEQRRAAEDDGAILCAPGGGSFRRACTVERTQTAGDLILTVRNPDGGFHRLAVTGDGRGVVAADGAEPARVSIVAPGIIEVAIADDRYRLPATIRGD